MRANISRVKSASSIMIVLPNSASTTPTTISLGTKLSVCSLIDVAAWIMPKMIPATSAGIRIGAEARARIHIACWATPMK